MHPSWPEVARPSAPAAEAELRRLVLHRTGRRVRHLRVAIQGGSVTLRGVAPSYHVKQLAQHAAFDLLPDVAVENAIIVADGFGVEPLREKTTKAS